MENDKLIPVLTLWTKVLLQMLLRDDAFEEDHYPYVLRRLEELSAEPDKPMAAILAFLSFYQQCGQAGTEARVREGSELLVMTWAERADTVLEKDLGDYTDIELVEIIGACFLKARKQ